MKRIAVHIHHSSCPEPLIRHLDALVQLKWLGLEVKWLEYICGCAQSYLEDGSYGIYLSDLKSFCAEQEIEVTVISGLNQQEARRIAIANCELSGLSPSPEIFTIVDQVGAGKLTTEAAINNLLKK